MKRIFTFILAVLPSVLALAQWPTNPNLNTVLNLLPSAQSAPDGATDGNNGAIIAWVDQRSGNADIYAQKINKDGIVQWALNGVNICSAPGSQTNVAIVPWK